MNARTRRLAGAFAACIVFAGLLAGAGDEQPAPAAPASGALARFHAKASRGDPVTVVFFGGSLTWGANASDPDTTSYRGRMGRYLLDRYPRTQIRLHDAAIGGTGSDLGMYRLERDVLAHRPDLVFLDWSINDDVLANDAKRARFYETILRRLVREDIAVFHVFLPVKWTLGARYRPEGQPRVSQYAKLANAYGTPWVDAAPHVQAATSAPGGPTLDECWPLDDTHPVDAGYRLYFEAVRGAFERKLAAPDAALAQKMPDEPLFGEYTTVVRQRITDALPDGWTRQSTWRTAMWHDGMASRWMDDVAVLDRAAAEKGTTLKMEFEGTTVGMFGEMDGDGLDIMVFIDGKPLPVPGKSPRAVRSCNTSAMGGGRLFFWRSFTTGLAPGRHTIEIVPELELRHGQNAAQSQLRIESLCYAW